MGDHRLREQTYGCWGQGIVREFGMDLYVYPAIFKMGNQQGPAVYSTWNSAQYYVAARMGGEFGREWKHIYVWLSPFAIHLKISQHC